jgi:hypothetical protein
MLLVATDRAKRMRMGYICTYHQHMVSFKESKTERFTGNQLTFEILLCKDKGGKLTQNV